MLALYSFKITYVNNLQNYRVESILRATRSDICKSHDNESIHSYSLGYNSKEKSEFHQNPKTYFLMCSEEM